MSSLTLQLRGNAVPEGYAFIPGGWFRPKGNWFPTRVRPFGIKKTLVVNQEWKNLVQGLGSDRYVILKHDRSIGHTSLEAVGESFTAVINNSEIGQLNQKEIDLFNRNKILIVGASVLLQLEDQIMTEKDEKVYLQHFTGDKQPFVSISWFGSQAAVLLLSLLDGNRWHYELPTDIQFEYVASNKGTQEYGTPTGKLFDENGKKLAQVDEFYGRNVENTFAAALARARGWPASLDHPFFPPTEAHPFGVNAIGRAERWMAFNHYSKGRKGFTSDFHEYGLRGGSWVDDINHAQASYRSFLFPWGSFDSVGFQPVVYSGLSEGDESPDILQTQNNPITSDEHTTNVWAPSRVRIGSRPTGRYSYRALARLHRHERFQEATRQMMRNF